MKSRSKILSLIIAFTIFILLCGCDNVKEETVINDEYISVQECAVALIIKFNAEESNGFTVRDFGAPKLAWKHHYRVMDKEYTLEKVNSKTYKFYSIFTEYESEKNAGSPEEAQKLEEYTPFDRYKVITEINYVNNSWQVTDESEVYSEANQRWNREYIFYTPKFKG